MKPNRAAFLLRCLLVFNGVMVLLALPAVFMPTAWMDYFHRDLGLGPLPRGPIVEYLTRSISCAVCRVRIADAAVGLGPESDLRRS